MTRKARSHDVLGKLSAFSMAVILLLSIFVPMFASTVEAGAASNSYNGEIYVDFSQNSIWNQYAQNGTVKVVNDTAMLSSVSGKNGLYSSGNVNLTNSVEIVREAAIADPATNYSRIYLDISDWSDKDSFNPPKIDIYQYGNNNPNAIPLASMHRVKSDSYLYYYDYNTTYGFDKFNIKKTDTSQNSGNANMNEIPLSTLNDNLVMTSASQGSCTTRDLATTDKTSKISLGSLNLDQRADDSCNKIYVDANGGLSWSTYPNDNTSGEYGTDRTITLYAPNWTAATLVYDLNEPESKRLTAEMTAVTKDVTVNGETKQVKVFEISNIKLPDTAKLGFHPGIVSQMTQTNLPADLNQTLVYSLSSNQWVTLESLVSQADAQLPQNFGENILGVKTTYFDYFEDKEILEGYKHVNGSNGQQFTRFNYWISEYWNANKTWMHPLYFGMIGVNTRPTINNGSSGYALPEGYALGLPETDSNNMSGEGDDKYYQSIQGLVYPQLDANGDLQAAEGVKMPFFSESILNSSTTDYARIYDSYFPFVINDADNGIKKYTFSSSDPNSSQNSYDNVYFDWSGDTPTTVKYSRGDEHAIENSGSDPKYGIYPFNNVGTVTRIVGENEIWIQNQSGTEVTSVYYANDSSGTGEIQIPLSNLKIKNYKSNDFYVIDTTKYTGAQYIKWKYTWDAQADKGDSGWKAISDLKGNAFWVQGGNANISAVTTKESRDYGFGLKMEMDFRVPANGTLDGTPNGEPVTFEYSGDDDLWVFIDNQLVLDLGGNHRQSTGKIDFKAMTATVDKSAKIYDDVDSAYAASYVNSDGSTYYRYFNGSDVNNIIHLDTTTTHKLTVFYLERGMVDSNLNVSFTMTPVTNDFTVTNTIDSSNINKGFRYLFDDEAFSYTTSQSDATIADGTFTIANGARNTIAKGMTANAPTRVVQSVSATTSSIVYSTKNSLYDILYPKAFHSDKVGVDTESFKFLNSKNDINLNTSLQADYVNTPTPDTLVISKTVVDKDGNTLTSDGSFTFNVGISKTADGTYTYSDFEYTLTDKDNTPINDPITGTNVYTAENGTLILKNGQKATITGIPQGVFYKVEETGLAPGYSVLSLDNANGQITDSTGEVAFVNKFDPAENSLQIGKKLDGEPYNGSDFTFKATLIDFVSTNTGDTVTTGQTYTSSDAVNGVVTFPSAIYEKVGSYYYSIEESRSEGVDADKYIMDPNHTYYYAKIDVVSDSGRLVVQTTTYGTGYSEDNKQLTGTTTTTMPYFENRTATKYTDVSFVKQDGNGNPLSGAEFTLYIDEACEKQATISDVSKEGSGFTNPATSAENTGLVTFSQLKYEPSASGDVKATYYFKETKAPNGYQLLTGTFKIEIAADDTYKIYYDNSELSKNADNATYVVNNIKQPELPIAGGVGVTMFYVLGALAVVIAVTAFVLYKKRINVIALAAQLIHRK